MGFICGFIKALKRGCLRASTTRHTDFGSALNASRSEHAARSYGVDDRGLPAVARVVRDLDAAVFEATKGRVRARTADLGIELHCSGTSKSQMLLYLEDFDAFPLQERYTETFIADENAFRHRIIQEIARMPYEQMLDVMSFDQEYRDGAPLLKVAELMKSLKAIGYRGASEEFQNATSDVERLFAELETGVDDLTDGYVEAHALENGIDFRTRNGSMSFLRYDAPPSNYPMVIEGHLVGNSVELEQVVTRLMRSAWHDPSFQSLLAEAR